MLYVFPGLVISWELAIPPGVNTNALHPANKEWLEKLTHDRITVALDTSDRSKLKGRVLVCDIDKRNTKLLTQLFRCAYVVETWLERGKQLKQALKSLL